VAITPLDAGSPPVSMDASRPSKNDGAIDGSVPNATIGEAGPIRQDAQAAAPDQDASSTGRSFPTDREAFGLGSGSRCAQADVLLCEDFEADDIDTSVWEVQTWNSGSAGIDATQAARGKHSVHITEPSAISRVMLRETKSFAQTGNHFYGRFFARMSYAPAPLQCDGNGCTNLVHWTLASAGGNYSEGGQTYRPDVRAVGAVNQGFLVNLDGGPKPEVGISDEHAPTGYTGFDASHVDQWMCFEFEYAGEGEAAEVRVWWDGQEHPDLHYSTNRRGDKGELWPIPKYDYLDIGLAHYQDYGAFVSAFEAWIDEIIVDDERVGCAL
jgi:hypothetical protein